MAAFICVMFSHGDIKVVDDLGQPGTEGEPEGPVGLQLPLDDVPARM